MNSKCIDPEIFGQQTPPLGIGVSDLLTGSGW